MWNIEISDTLTEAISPPPPLILSTKIYFKEQTQKIESRGNTLKIA